jgi:heme oxygenase (mycobilin-producing)
LIVPTTCFTLRVVVKDGYEAEFLERYDALCRRIAEGLDGHVVHELSRDLDDPGCWLILSRWESLEASQAWERSDEHRELTLPLRECWDDARRHGYELVMQTEHPRART